MTPTITDISIPCADCGEPFAFTVSEQHFYAERGMERPSRCPDCRARRRSERNADAVRAAETAPATGGDGFGNFLGAVGVTRKGARSGLKMYSVVCSSCGRSTEVPFEPRSGRPVYCRDCFSARRSR